MTLINAAPHRWTYGKCSETVSGGCTARESALSGAALSSGLNLSTVDGQLRSGHEAALIRGQEQHR
ncbi:hypothetical protein, partial [Streptomyces sp. DSM 41033]|uniref:hypothetical protein n=1 Tax=Streptomyces sp. DSM 41033 TaxID=3448655 RepID=UPI00404004E9